MEIISICVPDVLGAVSSHFICFSAATVELLHGNFGLQEVPGCEGTLRLASPCIDINSPSTWVVMATLSANHICTEQVVPTARGWSGLNGKGAIIIWHQVFDSSYALYAIKDVLRFGTTCVHRTV